jgi:hypothetical protein
MPNSSRASWRPTLLRARNAPLIPQERAVHLLSWRRSFTSRSSRASKAPR